MPPKKKGAEAEKPLFGRPGNNLKMGIVGLPNVGILGFVDLIIINLIKESHHSSML